MKGPKDVLRALDRVQQGSAPLAFTYGIVKKFGDDNAGSLAALLTYYGFLSLFPLLLLLVTVLGLVAGSNPAWTARVEHSALAQFPVIGNQLGGSIHALHHRSAVGLAVGIVGLVWGSQGAVQSGQYAMAEVWNVPHLARPGFVARLGRTVGTLAVVGTFLLVSTALAGTLTVGSRSPAVMVAGVVATVALNVGIFAVAFRLLTPAAIAWKPLVPGAVVGGAGWSVLQYVGGLLVDHTLRNSSQVYGFFAVVLGLLAWIYLAAELVLYSAELNVVRARHLWPRSLTQPPLTPADRRVLADLAVQTKRRPEQEVAASFDPGTERAVSPAGSTEVERDPEPARPA